MRPVLLWDGQGQAPVGWESHTPILWRDFETAPGQYRFDRVDRMLAAAERPCHLELVIYTQDMVDLTPAHARKTHLLTVGERTAEMPGYADEDWQAAYWAAIGALARQYGSDRRVASFWLGPGINQETQAIVPVGGVDWPSAARKVLRESDYLRFLKTTTETTLMEWRAWGDKPVYLAAGPSPANTWLHTQRNVSAECLAMGAHYRFNGWAADRSQSIGLGEYAGLMHYDLKGHASGLGLEATANVRDATSDTLYWMLLAAMGLGAEIVCLYRSWLPLWDKAVAQLPTADRWIVFRDAEYPQKRYMGGNGKVYGHAGWPGCWARGAELIGEPRLAHLPDYWDWGRWYTAGPLVIGWPGLADGLHRWRIGYCNGVETDVDLPLHDGALTLPVDGTGYHRVEWLGPAESVLPLPERVADLERRVAALEGRTVRMS